MKPKLTKAQLAKAKRAVVGDMLPTIGCAYVGRLGQEVFRNEPEWREVERLLRVALRAVRGA